MAATPAAADMTEHPFDPVEWLGARAQVGDLILTGDEGFVGRIIQTGSGSRFSHAAVVIGDGEIIEAYDYGLLPSKIKSEMKLRYRDYGDGISRMSFAHLVERSDGPGRLRVRRPHAIEPTALQAAADRFHETGPEFATFATCMLAVLGTMSGTAGHRFGDSLRSGARRATLFAKMLDFQAGLIGDREHKVHCAELATRLYVDAGVPLVFTYPVLAPVMLSLARDRGLPDDDFVNHRVDLTEASAGTAWEKALDEVEQRRGRIGFRPADRADFILPGDFERAEPFDDIGELRRDGSSWSLVMDGREPTS